MFYLKAGIRSSHKAFEGFERAVSDARTQVKQQMKPHSSRDGGSSIITDRCAKLHLKVVERTADPEGAPMLGVKKNSSVSPNRLPWPPLIVAAAALSALALGRGLPLPAITNVWVRMGGGLIAGLGVALDLWAIVTMRRAHTNILPHRPADHLVTWGPFSITRNPIYVGNNLLMLGIGLCFENLWFVLFGIAASLLVDRLAIRREECHLAKLFGKEWTEYSSCVPRWLI